MQGKRFMISATWNAPRETFDNSDSFLYSGKGTADLFLHITSNYRFCGYDILPDFESSTSSRIPTSPASSMTMSAIWSSTLCAGFKNAEWAVLPHLQQPRLSLAGKHAYVLLREENAAVPWRKAPRENSKTPAPLVAAIHPRLHAS